MAGVVIVETWASWVLTLHLLTVLWRRVASALLSELSALSQHDASEDH